MHLSISKSAILCFSRFHKQLLCTLTVIQSTYLILVNRTTPIMQYVLRKVTWRNVIKKEDGEIIIFIFFSVFVRYNTTSRFCNLRLVQCISSIHVTILMFNRKNSENYINISNLIRNHSLNSMRWSNTVGVGPIINLIWYSLTVCDHILILKEWFITP